LNSLIFFFILTHSAFKMATTKVSIDSKLESANKYKQEGNELYKEKKYRAAAGKYHRAILYLKGIDTDLHGTPAFLQAASVNPDQKNCISKETEQECIQLNISVHNNLCATLLLMHSTPTSSSTPDIPINDQQQTSTNQANAESIAAGERIKHLAEVVIELDEKNEKAWFRRGQACLLINNFDAARESFRKVVDLSNKTNLEAAKLLHQCVTKLQQQSENQKKMYQNMFWCWSAWAE